MKPCDKLYSLRTAEAEIERQRIEQEDRQRLAKMRQQPETAEARYFVPLTRFPAYSVDLSKHQP